MSKLKYLMFPVLVVCLTACLKKNNEKAEEDDKATYDPRISNNIIVFAASENGSTLQDLFSIAPDGSSVTNLTNTPTLSEENPAISHDGKRIAFQREETLVHNNFDMSDEEVLNNGAFSSGSFIPAAISWSARSTFLTFHDRDDDPHIYYVRSNYNDLTVEVLDRGFQRLDSGKATFATFSPEDNALCYVKNSDDSVYLLEIGTPGGNGDEVAPVTIFTSDRPIAAPRFSKDGAQIAFTVLNENGGSTICTIQADGSDFQEVVGGDASSNISPCFSPDGTQLVYASNSGNGGSFDLFVLNLDGTESITNLTNTPDREEISPFWN